MESSFYERAELEALGFASLGSNVRISRKSSLYGIRKMHVGSNVRVDDFCILSGSIVLHDYIHISAGNYLFAGDVGIEMHDFSGLSSRCAVYAVSDDYSGDYLTNPMVPEEYRRVVEAKVELGKHVIVGTSSVILPGVSIGEGSSVGSMSLVLKPLDPYGVYVGVPVRKIKERSRKIFELEETLRRNESNLG